MRERDEGPHTSKLLRGKRESRIEDRESSARGYVMKDENKTKSQLIKKLADLRKIISELEKSEVKRKKAEEELQKLKDELEIKVSERTKELEEKIKELEIFYDAAVDCELKMEELRKKIAYLEREKGGR